MDQILKRLIERFGPTAMGDWLAQLLPRLITAAIVLLVFYLIWKLLDRGFRLVRRKVDLDPTVATFIGTAIRYVAGGRGDALRDLPARPLRGQGAAGARGLVSRCCASPGPRR